MLERFFLPTAATLLLAAFALSPQPAAASWINAPAATTAASQADLADVIDVRRRSRHQHRSWAGPFFAAPFFYAPYAYGYYPYPRHRCGYVWNPRLYRHIWSCR